MSQPASVIADGWFYEFVAIEETHKEMSDSARCVSVDVVDEITMKGVLDVPKQVLILGMEILSAHFLLLYGQDLVRIGHIRSGEKSALLAGWSKGPCLVAKFTRRPVP